MQLGINTWQRFWRRTHTVSTPRQGTVIIQPLPGIGDMVWHLPHLHALAAIQGPLTLVTKQRSQAQELLNADPSVQRIIILDRNEEHAGIAGLLRLVRILKQGNFAHAWLFHGSLRYALALYLAKIPRISGYGRGWQRFLLNAITLPKTLWHAHPIAKADALLDRAGIPKVAKPILVVDQKLVQEIQTQYAHCPQPWIALGIGSSEAYKQWGEEKFSLLASALYQHYCGTIFLLGGTREQLLAHAIIVQTENNSNKAPIYPEFTLSQTAALLFCCRLFIGNDTGTLNMAAALDKPAIGLFGGTAPLQHLPSIIPIMPSRGSLQGQRGIAAIQPEQVLFQVRASGL